jgi:hypothetical protein
VSLPLSAPVSRLLQHRDRVPSRCGLIFHKAWLVKAVQAVLGVVGARLLGLDCHATLCTPHGRLSLTLFLGVTSIIHSVKQAQRCFLARTKRQNSFRIHSSRKLCLPYYGFQTVSGSHSIISQRLSPISYMLRLFKSSVYHSNDFDK